MDKFKHQPSLTYGEPPTPILKTETSICGEKVTEPVAEQNSNHSGICDWPSCLNDIFLLEMLTISGV